MSSVTAPKDVHKVEQVGTTRRTVYWIVADSLANPLDDALPAHVLGIPGV